MNEAISQELDDLMLSHQEDGGLSSNQHDRLREILLEYPEARRQYAQQQLIDAALHLEQSAGLDMAPLATPPTVYSYPLFSTIHWLGLAASVVLALGVGLGLGGYLFSPSDATLVDSQPEPIDDSVALVTQALEVEWLDDQKIVAGTPLPTGRLALASGLLQLEFYSGAQLIVEGPAELELLGPNEATCYRGKLRAFVPEHAKGFTVHAPQFQLVDLGTEFGIQVGADGAAEVQVFDGEVELYHPENKRQRSDAEPLQRLLGGKGLSWTDTSEVTPITPQPDAYTSFDDVQHLSKNADRARYQSWQEWSQATSADPRLIAYYDFQGQSSRLLDRSDSGRHGTIVGSERTQGRFPGKGALEFKRTADRVRIHIPEHSRQLTLSVWLRMDALTGRTQALLTSDGFEPYDTHWQVSRRGELAFGTRLPHQDKRRQAGYDSPPILGAQTLGRWQLLCVVYDLDAGVVKHFVNGKLISSEATKADQSLAFGRAEIGNWAKQKYQSQVQHKVRNFCGRIDELILWQAALSDTEIRDMYQRTRP